MDRRLVTIKIEAKAQGKGRARGGAHGFHFTPKKTRDYEKMVAEYAALAMRNTPIFVGPVCIGVFVKFKTPKSWTKKKTAEKMGKGHTSVPDADNIMKGICDALNGIVFKDDSQICRWVGAKTWGSADAIEIEIGGEQ